MVLHAVIRGRVQGVGFRYWVLSEARKLRLKGWVRNLSNGGVEVEAEGAEDDLFELEQLLWKGPVMSRVDDVQCQRSDGERDFATFSITH